MGLAASTPNFLLPSVIDATPANTSKEDREKTYREPLESSNEGKFAFEKLNCHYLPGEAY
jgi:hypothetical protein